MTRTLPRVALAVAEIILFMIVVTLISAGNARSQGAVAPPETRHMPTSVGPYILARSVQKTSGLTELSPMEYSAFRSGNDPTIPQETIFKAAPVRFEGLEWQVMVASTKGRIYKIALHHGANNSDTDRIFQQMAHAFTGSIGKPSESSRPPSPTGKFTEFIWDAEEGNLVLEKGDLNNGESFVNWYMTSNIITRQ